MSTRSIQSVANAADRNQLAAGWPFPESAFLCYEEDTDTLEIMDPASSPASPTFFSIPLGSLSSHIGTLTGSVIQTKEVTYTETGAGTYTGTVALPAGATIIDIIVHATAVWDAATSAVMEVGDTDPDGFYTAVDLKATDLLITESLSFAKAGGQEGVYITATHVLSRYSASARSIIGSVVSVGAGTAGRTRMTVIFSAPVAGDIAAAVKT